MKNIFILPTDKPSNLYIYKNKLGLIYSPNPNIKLENTWDELKKSYGGDLHIPQYIYITSDDEIEKGNWGIDEDGIRKCENHLSIINQYYSKIVLTNDPDLIVDGVQSIDNEFFEWFVKNSDCKYVEIEHYNQRGDVTLKDLYKIKVPEENSNLNLSQLEKNLDNSLATETSESLSNWLNDKRESIEENKVLVEMQQILKKDSKIIGHYESCDLCHYNAFFKYLYNGEILYRCKGHKIVNINNLKSKFGFGNYESKKETLEDAAKNAVLNNSDMRASCSMGKFGEEMFKLGAKWKQEQSEKMYTEENLKEAFYSGLRKAHSVKKHSVCWKEWFEQFKKK